MPLSKPIADLASSFRKLIGNDTKLSLTDMKTLSELLKMDDSKQIVKPYSFNVDADKGDPWKQVEVSIVKPGTTYILMWDSHTTGTDKQVSARVYNYGSNNYLQGGRWGGIFDFSLGPHFFKFTTPTKDPNYAVILAKNVDGGNSGDGTTTFENVRLFKVGGVVKAVLSALHLERRCLA